MNRILAGLAAGLAASALVLSAPASADFFIKKKTKAPAAQPTTTTPRPAKAPRRTRPVEAPEPVAALPTGIDPMLMQQAITEARYSAKLVRVPGARTATIEVTNGKTGWSVNFNDCIEENRCGSMEFYTLWRVSNEANVCSVWGTDVARDPGRTLGKPYCYVVPNLSKQLHLKLSSEQQPYNGLDRLGPNQAKERMASMIGVWSSALTDLPQAWDVAVKKCPKSSDRCGGNVVAIPPAPPPPKGSGRY